MALSLEDGEESQVLDKSSSQAASRSPQFQYEEKPIMPLAVYLFASGVSLVQMLTLEQLPKP